MEIEDNFVNKVIFVAGCIVVAPIIVGVASSVADTTINLASKGINKVKFHKEMKKGMKEGRIVRVDGHYYEMETSEEAK